jgi:spectinomycin phosphotransferase
VPERLEMALADAWQLRAASVEYLPEGWGGHHWVVTGADGLRHFVTVDDLDGKDWLGGTRQAVFEGLRRALGTAAALWHRAGLEFVVAPVPARDGELLRRLDGRYAVSVFPFLAGRSYPFGRYPDERLRGQALEMIAALHRSTATVRGLAPARMPTFSGRGDLDAFLLDPGRPWDGGPFSQGAHRLAAARATDVARLTAAGRELDHAVITLYRLRWYLDDLASAIRMFRHEHRDTPDTRQWQQGLAPMLEQLPRWLDLLD